MYIYIYTYNRQCIETRGAEGYTSPETAAEAIYQAEAKQTCA